MSELLPLIEDAPGPAVEIADGYAALRPEIRIGGALAVAILAVAFALVSYASFIARPYSDALIWLAEVIRHDPASAGVAGVWRSHNEQRIVVARLLTLSDVYLVKHARISFLVASVASMIAAAGLQVFMVCRWQDNRNFGWLLAVALSGLWLSVAAALDSGMSGFSVYVTVGAGALAAVLFWAASGQAGATGWAYLVLSCVFAIFAGFGNAAGLAVWPSLLVAALFRRDDRARIAFMAVMAGLVIWLMEAGLGSPGAKAGTGPLLAPAHVLKMARYFLQYCGMPWSKIGHLGVVADVIGFLVAALALQALTRRLSYGPTTTIWCGRALILFGMATAVMAALGRVDEADQVAVPIRYGVFSAILQIGIMMTNSDLIYRWWARNPSLGTKLAAGVFVLFVIQDAGSYAGGVNLVRKVAVAHRAFDRGDRSEQTLQFVYPGADAATAADVKRIYQDLWRMRLIPPP